jgi:hypothetical protein
MTKKVSKKVTKKEEAPKVDAPVVASEGEEVPKSFVECLEGLRARVEEKKDAIHNREAYLALHDCKASLEQAIRWAKFAEDAIKVNKLGVTL